LPHKKYYIISYDMLVRKITDFFPAFKFTTIICDESQYLKNKDSKRVRVLSPFLKQNSERLLFLTGTPMKSYPRDLFCQLSILHPTLFYDYYQFAVRYCDAKQTYWGWDDKGVSNIEELQFIVKNLCIRRLKKDILPDLPAKRRKSVYIEVKKTSKMKYQEKKFKQLLKCEGVSLNNNNDKEILFLISQMYTELSYVKVKPVLEYLGSIYENGYTEKTLIFGHHMHFLDALENFCIEKEIGYIRIDGTVDAKKRQNLVDEFRNPQNSKLQFAILGISATCTGLTFAPVSNVIYAELVWDFSTIAQSEDRINRIGAEDISEYTYLLAENTVDERLLKKLVLKNNLANAVVDFDSNNENGHTFEFIE